MTLKEFKNKLKENSKGNLIYWENRFGEYNCITIVETEKGTYIVINGIYKEYFDDLLDAIEYAHSEVEMW
jgi:hypothetical protein